MYASDLWQSASRIQWGPVGAWVGGVATFFAGLIALLASIGWFSRFDAPRLDVTFKPIEPWCRRVAKDSGSILWIRVAVVNTGRTTAHGCVGRLLSVTTGDSPRGDIDPLQLRWAGVPRSRSLQPIDIPRGERDYLNILFCEGATWQIDTFRDPDFDPGFPLTLAAEHRHRLELAVLCDNAEPQKLTIMVDALKPPGEDVVVQMR
jgi:hypothetical protein